VRQTKPVSDLLENICSNCPGTLWGEKSICRIHNKSIGEITSCEQWTRKNPFSYKENDGQMVFTDLEPAIEVVQKTEEDLRSYHWVLKEIERIECELNKAIQSFGPGRLTKVVLTNRYDVSCGRINFKCNIKYKATKVLYSLNFE
jgi:hypothetical protein